MRTTRAFLLAAIAIASASCASGPADRRAATLSRTAPVAAAAADPAIVPEQAAGDYVASLFRSRKIVFLSELHATVDPILFLAGNLRTFYDAGLRYLFVEAPPPGFRAIGRTDSRYEEPYFIYFIAPWTPGGWKYEEGLLSDAIRELNAGLPEGERLRIVSAENGHDASRLSGIELLNSRDAYAFETIRAAMDGSLEGSKGLVFYGASHGLREAGPWTTLGALLTARYGSSFADVDYEYADDLGAREGSRLYDAVILKSGPRTYGVCYQYIQTRANLVAMFMALRDLEASPRREELLAMPVYRSEYLLLVYYLRLYYGDRFGYDMWNPRGRMDDALSDIAPVFIGPGADPVAALEVRAPESLSTLEEYHRLIYEPATGSFGVDAARSFGKAVSMFPEDLWPSYGLAAALMEKGDYDGALALLESTIGERLSRCMGVLPDMYDRAAECARVLGRKEKAEDFRRARAELVNEHGLEPMAWRR
jgi:hypothetical protein